jgi:hypothetical protein
MTQILQHRLILCHGKNVERLDKVFFMQRHQLILIICLKKVFESYEVWQNC